MAISNLEPENLKNHLKHTLNFLGKKQAYGQRDLIILSICILKKKESGKAVFDMTDRKRMDITHFQSECVVGYGRYAHLPLSESSKLSQNIICLSL